MSTIYRKQGRRYIPISEYCPEAMDALPYGSHLVVVEHGGRYTRYNIMPAYAEVQAAIDEHREMLAKAIVKASEASRVGALTKRQQAAWDALRESFGGHIWSIQFPGAYQILDALRDAVCERISEARERDA